MGKALQQAGLSDEVKVEIDRRITDAERSGNVVDFFA